MKSFLLILNIFIFLSCSNNGRIKKVKVDNYIVEGRVLENDILDGAIKYSDTLGHLLSVINYENGIKNGTSVNYYINGIVSDSINYLCGKENGYWWHYDQQGFLTNVNYYYFGLRYGPDLLYENDKLSEFLFYDFNRQPLVQCTYDTFRDVKEVSLFKMNPIITDVISNDKKFMNFFVYLPKIPHSNQVFSLGISNLKLEMKELKILSSDRFFIDTLLPRLDNGWHYYISCHLRANNDEINKVYIEDLVVKE